MKSMLLSRVLVKKAKIHMHQLQFAGLLCLTVSSLAQVITNDASLSLLVLGVPSEVGILCRISLV